jgi:pseudouridine synthase
LIEGIRLQKYLARAGVASRRACEELIAAGRVRVDGEAVLRPGTRVGPESVVEVDGRRVEPSSARWIALHKPPGYVCAREDPQGRPTVYDLLPAELRPLFHVGRLDIMSEGLLLLTNEGEAAHRLMHPSDLTVRLLAGVELEDGLAAADEARLDLGRGRRGATLQLELHEGRNREVRRMMKALGVKIRSLKRLALGPIELGRLRPGEWRDLSEEEVAALRGDPTR